MTCVFYISGHGFGHASRDVEVIHAMARRAPRLRVIVRSAVPLSFFEVSARIPIDVQPMTPDPGVTQTDSVTIDETATARNAAAFYEMFDRHAEREARILASLDPSVVVGDVPPLAFAAAALTGAPSVLLANFTWDWIYEGYKDLVSHPRVLETIRRAYSQATVALRLPLHGGFAAVRDIVRDIPLIARKSRRDRADTRRYLGVAPGRPVVLASFSRYGIALPYDQIVAGGRFTLIVTDHDGHVDPELARHVLYISGQRLLASGLCYEDLVAASDVVVSKPGYGIVSECIANGAALLFAQRSGFIEQDLLIREMPSMLRCRPLDVRNFEEGRWWPDVEALLEQPPVPNRLALNGAEIAADAILTAAARPVFGGPGS